jgi:hypothetical protein
VDLSTETTPQLHCVDDGTINGECDDETSQATSNLNFLKEPCVEIRCSDSSKGDISPKCGCPSVNTAKKSRKQHSNNKFSKADKSNPAGLAWARGVSERIETLLFELHKQRWRTMIIHIENVKSYAPHVHHLVLDLECRPA